MAGDNDDLFGAPSWADAKPKPASTPPAGVPPVSPPATKPAPAQAKGDDLFGSAAPAPAPAARAPADAASKPATPTPPPSVPSTQKQPMPPAPSDLGKDPRRAASMRGKLASIINANRDRHADARKEHRDKLLRLEYDRRLRSLVAALREVTSFDGLNELSVLSRRAAPMPPAELAPPSAPRRCSACRCDLSNQPIAGVCPQCGTAFGEGPSRDFLAGDLYEHLVRKLRLICNSCNYSLRGLKPVGTCPECGAPYRTNAVDWADLAGVFARELVLPAKEITSSTFVLARIWQLTTMSVDGNISRSPGDADEDQ